MIERPKRLIQAWAIRQETNDWSSFLGTGWFNNDPIGPMPIALWKSRREARAAVEKPPCRKGEPGWYRMHVVPVQITVVER